MIVNQKIIEKRVSFSPQYEPRQGFKISSLGITKEVLVSLTDSKLLTLSIES